MFVELMDTVKTQQATIDTMTTQLTDFQDALDAKLNLADYTQADLALYATMQHVKDEVAKVAAGTAGGGAGGAGEGAGGAGDGAASSDLSGVMGQLAAKASEQYVDDKIDDAMRVMNMRYGKLIFGSPGNDRDDLALNGSSGNDIIYGEGGDDNLFGLMGHDTLHGGSGNDMLDGYDGQDVLYGDGGNDYLYGGNNDDILLGGSGTDYIYGDHGDDIIYGGHGSDYLYGENNDDVVRGENGNDYIEGNDGDDLLYGGKGYDWLFGGRGNDIMYGNQDYDIMYGGQGDDVMTGGGSTDVIYGDGGDDWIEGGSGEDKLYGDYRFSDGKVLQPGNDVIDARDGHYDYISGGPGNDVIFTDFDHNTGEILEKFLDGGPGCDVINGRLDPHDAVQRVSFHDIHGVSLSDIVTKLENTPDMPVKVEYKHDIRDAIKAEMDADEKVALADVMFNLGDPNPTLAANQVPGDLNSPLLARDLDPPLKATYQGMERVVKAVLNTPLGDRPEFALEALTYTITLDGNPACDGTFIPVDMELEKTLQDLGIDPEQWKLQNYGIKAMQAANPQAANPPSAQPPIDPNAATPPYYDPAMAGQPGVIFDSQGNVVPEPNAAPTRRPRANGGNIASADPDDSI